ncbi:transient receptor potential cation channel subfamily M member 2 [Biomphalaria glabrata]|nr:transient receptor potential cation channel subfamily M member 2 [Biomphalaria glabrata]
MFTFLEFLSGHHSFGPMIVMLKKTLKKYIAFFIILLNILVAYSIASESLLYPESEYDDWPSILNIFRKGFWAILGEYNLDEYELKDLDDLCTNNASLYKDFKQCPSEKSSYFVSVFLGMYALFIQIVLSSLIVALITKSIYKIQGDSESIFSHLVFQQVKKYATTRLLLPPFTLLLFRLWKRGNNPFCVELDIDKQLQEFEYSAAQPVIQKIRFARK